MIEPTIKSRPVYGTLSAQPGKDHLFIADAEGAQAILDLARTIPSGFFASSHIIDIPGPTGLRSAKRVTDACGAPTFITIGERLFDRDQDAPACSIGFLDAA